MTKKRDEEFVRGHIKQYNRFVELLDSEGIDYHVDASGIVVSARLSADSNETTDLTWDQYIEFVKGLAGDLHR